MRCLDGGGKDDGGIVEAWIVTRCFAQGVGIGILLTLQSCGAWPLGAVAGYDQHTLSFVSLLSENSAKLITNVTLIPVRPSSQIPLNQVMGTFGHE